MRTPINVITEDEAANSLVTHNLLATHNGVFHADDAFAVAFFTLVSPGMQIVRTRRQDIIDRAAVVVDVGGVDEQQANRYDHHQRGFSKRRLNGVPYAAFGLVWQHRGWVLDLLGSMLRGMPVNAARLISAVDATLVAAVDATDSGWEAPGDIRTTPRYGVSAVISALNPTWDEEPDFDAAFVRAVAVAQGILERAIRGCAAELAAESVVRAAITAGSASDDREILVLDKFCPWQATVIAEAPDAKLVVFRSEDGQFRVQAIPVALGSFESRLLLPESWGGMRGVELAAAIRASGGGIADDEAVFVHPGRFIGGATDFEAAMSMARTALSAQAVPA